jgi:hypothetical protein
MPFLLMPSNMDKATIMVSKVFFLGLNANETVSSSVFGANHWFKGVFRGAKAEMHGSPHAIDIAGYAVSTVGF